MRQNSLWKVVPYTGEVRDKTVEVRNQPGRIRKGQRTEGATLENRREKTEIVDLNIKAVQPVAKLLDIIYVARHSR